MSNQDQHSKALRSSVIHAFFQVPVSQDFLFFCSTKLAALTHGNEVPKLTAVLRRDLQDSNIALKIMVRLSAKNIVFVW